MRRIYNDVIGIEPITSTITSSGIKLPDGDADIVKTKKKVNGRDIIETTVIVNSPNVSMDAKQDSDELYANFEGARANYFNKQTRSDKAIKEAKNVDDLYDNINEVRSNYFNKQTKSDKTIQNAKSVNDLQDNFETVRHNYFNKQTKSDVAIKEAKTIEDLERNMRDVRANYYK